MADRNKGFTLIELIAVMVLLGTLSVVLFSRLGGINTAGVQGSRDDIIAAFSLAQQLAMARGGISLEIQENSVSVNQDNVPVNIGYYPLEMPNGIRLSSEQSGQPATVFVFDRLGKTQAGLVTVSGSGVSATITVESTGYAYGSY
ncbi:type II secretion system protein [Cellvibrio japonicus]|uniref:Msha pilin protein mshc n=1 Tax=Cellvibrio japonicus (strain Ueda107) TaxID=498211 RepID=B3PKC1_CELJU|nr:type II secretion system protein [Cellvibrio japonicus]ACE85693.1 msha pilin protein mshc [Cellvibrio japonicus Ueda107]QEI12793.1 type II secretion system protein [Cellvibrio japonicus]QEI16367.1 type II secretion system protein [Cellvibrio japonicus]QEI19945.1 type II secretion system protein [Cellvibrio japonicus]